MKLSVSGITTIVVVSLSALEMSVVPPLAAAQAASLNNSCSRLMWIAEDNIFALDEQVFSSEADGRDRVRLSAQGYSNYLANRFNSSSWMPDGRALLYNTNRDFETQKSWIVSADGTDVRTLPRAADHIEASPSGFKLALHGNGGVKIMRQNGNIIGSYRAASVSYDLAWSSTNHAMAWIDVDYDFNTKSLILADGKAQNSMVLSTGTDWPTFHWSPSGSKIAWSDTSSILLANKNGSNQEVIWSNSTNHLRWSPDGSRLAWIDGSSIMVANADGTNPTPITSSAQSWFEWSPDGNRIAWYDGVNLQLISAAGGVPTVLPIGNDVDYGVSYSFSPDGTRLAWMSDHEIWVADSDGSDAILSYTSDESEIMVFPDWSPDSKVFANNIIVDGVHGDIQVSNADGSVHKRIVSSAPRFVEEVYMIGWSPCVFTPLGPTPDNDQFANAEYLEGASEALVSGTTLTVYGSTEEATSDGDEPGHFVDAFGYSQGPRTSIWYRWTSEVDQIVEMDTEGSEVDTVLVAYTGATEAELLAVATGIDRVKDVSRIRFAARAGETYHIVVDGYNSDSEGNIQLNVRQPTMDLLECTITGTDGPDILTGTTGADVICALGGDDEIRGLGGPDIIFAGNGKDFVSSGGGNDIVFGEDGKDEIVGGSGEDLISGGLLADMIFGGKDDDTVFGGRGADRVFGSTGDDVLFGETGGDALFGGSDNDYLDGGQFNDSCVDTNGANTLVNCE